MKIPLHFLLDEVLISDFGERFQDSNDLLLDDLNIGWSNILPNLNDHDYAALNGLSPPGYVANLIEMFEPQLSAETTRQYKLCPLLFLKTVASFTEDYTKIEPSTCFLFLNSPSIHLPAGKQTGIPLPLAVWCISLCLLNAII